MYQVILKLMFLHRYKLISMVTNMSFNCLIQIGIKYFYMNNIIGLLSFKHNYAKVLFDHLKVHISILKEFLLKLPSETKKLFFIKKMLISNNNCLILLLLKPTPMVITKINYSQYTLFI